MTVVENHHDPLGCMMLEVEVEDLLPAVVEDGIVGVEDEAEKGDETAT